MQYKGKFIYDRLEMIEERWDDHRSRLDFKPSDIDWMIKTIKEQREEISRLNKQVEIYCDI